MQLWDQESIDLMGPAFMEFGHDGSGRFRSIAVEGQMDCRLVTEKAGPLPTSAGRARRQRPGQRPRLGGPCGRQRAERPHLHYQADHSALIAIRAAGEAT
jgi:hypothetical protein